MVAAWQKVTVDWWDTQRDRFDLYTSDVTFEEAGRGDPKAAERRLEALSGVSVLPITEAVVELSKALLQGEPFRLRRWMMLCILQYPPCMMSTIF